MLAVLCRLRAAAPSLQPPLPRPLRRTYLNVAPPRATSSSRRRPGPGSKLTQESLQKACDSVRLIGCPPRPLPSGLEPMSTASRATPMDPETRIEPPPTVPRLPPAPDSSSRAAHSPGTHADHHEFSLETIRPAFAVAKPCAAVRVPAKESARLMKELARMLHLRPHSINYRPLMFCLASVPEDLREQLERDARPMLDSSFHLGYEHFSAEQVLGAILPQSLVAAEGTPSSFTTVGHILHLNLREAFLPYRFAIGKVLLDKTHGIRSVVNKLDTIDNRFRVFRMELLAGDEDYEAEVSESDCIFRLDFRTVYWNSRLHAEHARLVSQLAPFSVLADVMAGIGPFAVPAARHRFVWTLANDLNPESFAWLRRNARLNHVEGEQLEASCLDGRAFVRRAVEVAWSRAWQGPRWDGVVPRRKSAKERAREEHARRLLLGGGGGGGGGGVVAPPTTMAGDGGARRAGPSSPAVVAGVEDRGEPPPPRRRRPRRLVDHFIMNLPASALEFLDAYRGLYTHLSGFIEREARGGGGSAEHGEAGESIDGRAVLEEELEARRREEDEAAAAAGAGEGRGTAAQPSSVVGGSSPVRPWVHVHCFTKQLEFPHEDIVERANRALGLSESSPARLVAPPSPPPDKRALSGATSTSALASNSPGERADGRDDDDDDDGEGDEAASGGHHPGGQGAMTAEELVRYRAQLASLRQRALAGLRGVPTTKSSAGRASSAAASAAPSPPPPPPTQTTSPLSTPADPPPSSAAASAAASPLVPTPGVSLHHVRAVAPNKDMYCLSFRLPDEVLFAPATGVSQRQKELGA